MAERGPWGARQSAGLVILAVGMLAPLTIPLVLRSGMSDGLKTGISGALAIGIPEVMTIAAIAIMGRAGHERIKAWAARLLPRIELDRDIGPVRHAIGLVLFVVPLLLGLIMPYVLLKRPLAQDLALALHAGGDLMFLISVFVLGGDFWEKLRGLFVRTARITPTPTASTKRP